jgi:multiple RNA-binding domain-containing protein 1
LDAEKKSKGFGFVQFVIPEQAQRAREELDGSSFQGRLLHVINAKRAPEVIPKEGERGGSRLSSFQQKKEEDRRKMAGIYAYIYMYPYIQVHVYVYMYI